MHRYGPKYNRGIKKYMKKITENETPVNSTGPNVSGTEGDTSFSPRLFGILRRAILKKKKK